MSITEISRRIKTAEKSYFENECWWYAMCDQFVNFSSDFEQTFWWRITGNIFSNGNGIRLPIWLGYLNVHIKVWRLHPHCFENEKSFAKVASGFFADLLCDIIRYLETFFLCDMIEDDCHLKHLSKGLDNMKPPTCSGCGAGILISKQRERIGEIILLVVCAQSIIRRLAIYFSIVLLNAAWASLESWSASFMITTGDMWAKYN